MISGVMKTTKFGEWTCHFLNILKSSLKENSESLAPPENGSNPSELLPDDSSELSLFEDIPVVVTASKKPERITSAPAIVSVITQEDIEQMGARTIIEVLRTIPGMELMKDTANISQIAVRGLRSETSSGVKILLDGHALNNPITGGATKFYDDIPLRHVHRIEVIRGPASVSYGANAFVSVINIITKRPQDIDGTEITFGAGNFGTFNPSLLFSKTLNEVDMTWYVDYFVTAGAELFMSADAVSLYDETSLPVGEETVSLAPGNFQEEQEQFYLSWTLDYLDVTLRGGFSDKQRGPFLTSFYALNEDSAEDTRHLYSEVEYRRFLTKRLELSSRVYGDYFWLKTTEQVAPGILLSSSDDSEYIAYPEGVIAKERAESWRLGSEIQLNIRLFENNDLTIGTAYEYASVENVTSRTNKYNADLGISPENLIDIRAVVPEVDLTSIQSFAAIFAQDTWQIRHNLDLTLGIRGDYFRDFGAVFTPKIGLTYQADPDLNFKLLFGSAFRIPSFKETFIESITRDSETGEEVVVRDLEAEELRTFEVGVGYRPVEWLIGEINYFYTDINELAESDKGEDTGSYPIGTSQVYQNIGGIDVQGVEVELRGKSEKEIGLGIIPRIMNSTFRLNYSYQDTKDSITHEKVPNMARHKGNIGVGLNLSAEPRPDDSFNTSGIFRTLSKEFSLYFNLYLCGERQRSRNDPRPLIPEFAILDMTLTAYNVFEKGLDFSFSIDNLFDEDYRDPSPEFTGDETSSVFPDDFPNPGRTIFVELRYTF